MIVTTESENQIISQVMAIAFGADIAPSEIKGLQVHDKTVVIITSYALYSLGKDYFRQLVKQIKANPEAVVAETQVEIEGQQAASRGDRPNTANNKQKSHTKMARLTLNAVNAKAEAKGWSVEKRRGGYVMSNKLTPWGEYNGWYRTLKQVNEAIALTEPCNPTIEEMIKFGHFN